MEIRLPLWFFLALLGTVSTAFSQPSPEANEYLVIQQQIEAGDLAKAQARVEAALRARPQDSGLLNLRGILHAQRKEVSDARKDFSNAVRLKPSLLPAWRNLGRACQLVTDNDAADSACAIRAWERVARLTAPELDPEAQA